MFTRGWGGDGGGTNNKYPVLQAPAWSKADDVAVRKITQSVTQTMGHSPCILVEKGRLRSCRNLCKYTLHELETTTSLPSETMGRFRSIIRWPVIFKISTGIIHNCPFSWVTLPITRYRGLSGCIEMSRFHWPKQWLYPRFLAKIGRFRFKIRWHVIFSINWTSST